MARNLVNKNVFESTEKLYLNADLADVHFLFKDGDSMQKIPANKAILAIRSPVFNRMFFGAIKEEGNVEIVDADVNSFKEFLQIFYLNEVVVNMEHMEVVVRLADKYDVLGYFTDACANLIGELKLEEMCWGYQLAIYVKNAALEEHCGEKIIRSPKAIFASDSFKRCELATLKRILELNLTCYEGDVLKACLIWGKQSCQLAGLDENNSANLRFHLGDCLKSIRFGEIRIGDFMELTITHDELFLPEEFKDTVRMMTLKSYESKLFNSNSRTYHWDEDENEDEMVTIHRDIIKFTFNDPEVVSFTSNQPALLGAIYASAINIPLPKFDVKLVVKELDAYFSKNSEKILHDDIYPALPKRKIGINLHQPVLIKAHTLYEIHLTVPNLSDSADVSFFSGWKLSGGAEDSIGKSGFEIKFYENPHLNYNNSCEGWITDLDFQPV